MDKKEFEKLWNRSGTRGAVNAGWQAEVICSAVDDGYIPEKYYIYSMEDFEMTARNYVSVRSYYELCAAAMNSPHFSFSDDFFVIDVPAYGDELFISCKESMLRQLTRHKREISDGAYKYLEEQEGGADVILQHVEE